MNDNFFSQIHEVDTDASLVIIDSHEFRRKLISRFFFGRIDERRITLVEADGTESLLARKDIGNSSGEDLTVILSIGGASLSDACVLKEILAIKNNLTESPLIIIADDVGDLQVRLGIEIGVSGIIPTTMSPSQVVGTYKFIVDGGRFFPNCRSQCQQRHLDHFDHSPTVITTHDQPESEAIHDSEDIIARLAVAHPTVRSDGPTVDHSEPDGHKDDHVSASALDHLTHRQIDVLKALVPGLSNKQIARELDLSDATVKVHIRNLMKKLGADNRTQLALIGSKFSDLQFRSHD